MTAQLAVDGNVAPVSVAHVAVADTDVFFSTSNGSETQIRLFEDDHSSTIAEHRLFSVDGYAELEFLLEVSGGVLYGFTAPFYEEDLAAATFQIWYASASSAPRLVRELPVMNAFGEFHPPTDATSIGGNVLLRDASSRYQLINPAGTTIATWSAAIENNCGSPTYSPAIADGDGATIEAAYGCSRFVAPLFVHSDGRSLSEVEVHPDSLYLPSATLVTSEFTRESMAEELKFRTIAGKQTVRVDGGLVKAESLTRFGADFVFFAGDNGTSGREPWITDGTVEGTRMLRDINPTGASQPTVVGKAGGNLVFSAFNELHGVELWVTDGTSYHTSMLGDLNPGSGNSNPVSVTASLAPTKTASLPTDTLFFWIDGAGGTRQLWATNGTFFGTQKIVIADLPASTELTAIAALADGSTALSFSDADNHLQVWISDGTVSGTRRIGDLPSLGRVEQFTSSDANSNLLTMRLANGEVWTLNRLSGRAARIWSDSISLRTSGFHPKNISALGERVLFTTDEDTKSRVWIWSPATQELFSPGIIAIGSKMTIRVLSPDTVIFTEFNTVRVLHKNKLSALGTQLLLQHEAAGGHSYLLSSKNKLTIVDANLQLTHPEELILNMTVNNEALFAINESGAVVRYHGTTSLPLSAPLFTAEARLYPRSAGSLWVVEQNKIHRFDISTGRIARTWLADEPLQNPVVNNEGSIFWHSASNRTLKTLRGDQIVELISTRDVVDIEKSIVVGNRIFFVGVNLRKKRSLWTTTGLPTDTQRLGVIAGLQNLTTDGRKLYFTGEHAIWESDGTPNGTHPLPLIQSEQINATADRLQVIGTDLYFSASDGTHGNELFYAALTPDRISNGDVNQDGSVNFADFLIISAHFGSDAEQLPSADLDADGRIGFTDFLVFSRNFHT